MIDKTYVIGLEDRIKSIFEYSRTLISYETFKDSLKTIFKSLAKSEFNDLLDYEDFLKRNPLAHQALLNPRLKLIKPNETRKEFFTNESISFLSCKIKNFIQKNDESYIYLILLHDSEKMKKNSISTIRLNNIHVENEKSEETGLCFETQVNQSAFVTFINISNNNSLENLKYLALICTLQSIINFILKKEFEEYPCEYFDSLTNRFDCPFTNENGRAIILFAIELFISTHIASAREISDFLFDYIDSYGSIMKKRFKETHNSFIELLETKEYSLNELEEISNDICYYNDMVKGQEKFLKDFKEEYEVYFNINQ